MPNVTARTTRLRYVLVPELQLFRVTILDSDRWTCFIVQPPFFRAVTGIGSGKVLGTVRVNADQLVSLTGMPAKKEVSTDDARSRFVQYA
ncbi:hypothetical protein [Paenibacillus soyae]|uniref:Uncharacterized protein n=1 Tax=Paenibacillus soyae TaxID=2969249 RepID=A0A9X2MS79_9BACL|nr:hypothetical protein [Paenibacillus soyae]MCR2805322.1 hypothetical protein [Paenibacillus soyae]